MFEQTFKNMHGVLLQHTLRCGVRNFAARVVVWVGLVCMLATPVHAKDSVLKGLDWLKERQQENGSWENDVAYTGLVLVCYVKHGESPLSESYGDCVKRGFDWLAAQPIELKGIRSPAETNALAAWALGEADFAWKIPQYRKPLEERLHVLIAGQQQAGGFDYFYTKGARYDTHVTLWQVRAMRAAWLTGIRWGELISVMRNARRFFKQTAHLEAGFTYSNRGATSKFDNNAAVGALALWFLGEGRSPEAQAALPQALARGLPAWEAASEDWPVPIRDLTLWFYETEALYELTSGQGNQWTQWNRTFSPVLIKNQHPDGYWIAAKQNTDSVPASPDERILATALCLLQLEVYHLMHAPIVNLRQTSIP